MTTFSQKNLIFLISQPRAGSTLTQRVLGSHQEIHTVSEPWIMLHPLYALRGDGYQTEYSVQNSKKALDSFLGLYPEGEDAYVRGVRQMYLNLYGGLLQGSEKKFFLDKTPRYYHILPELYRTFPEAKYIFLLRNPLAILCSIFKTFIQDCWWRIQYYQSDLLKAPSLIARGIPEFQDKCTVLRYEDLLVNPEKEVKTICNFLNVSFDPEIIRYGQSCDSKWLFGDPSLVYQEKKPLLENCDRWQQQLQNPIIWQSASNYLEFLGEELLTCLGYSYAELQEVLERQKPNYEVVLPPALQEFFTSANMFRDESLQPFMGIVGYTNQLVETYSNLAKVLLQEKKVEEALKYLQIALQVAPFVPETHCLISEGLLVEGKLDRAIFHYKKAIQMSSKLEQSQLKSTKIAFEEALRRNPTHMAIAELLDTI